MRLLLLAVVVGEIIVLSNPTEAAPTPFCICVNQPVRYRGYVAPTPIPDSTLERYLQEKYNFSHSVRQLAVDLDNQLSAAGINVNLTHQISNTANFSEALLILRNSLQNIIGAIAVPTPAPAKCALKDAMTSTSFLRDSAINATYQALLGYVIPIGGYMQVDLSVSWCRDTVFLSQVCLLGNVQKTELQLKSGYGSEFSIFAPSLTTSSDTGVLCLTLKTNTSALILRPRQLISSRSSASEFAFQLSIIGCFNSIDPGCYLTTTAAPPCVPVDGISDIRVLPPIAFLGSDYNDLVGFTMDVNTSFPMEVDLTVNNCRSPPYITKICFTGNFRQVSLQYVPLRNMTSFVLLPGSDKMNSTDYRPMCLEPNITIAILHIRPQKIYNPILTKYTFYLQIFGCMDRLTGECGNTGIPTMPTIPSTMSSISTSSKPTTTTASTTTLTSPTITTVTTTSTSPMPTTTVCPLVNAMSDKTVLPEWIVSGGSFSTSNGWTLNSGSSALDIDLTVRNCRNATYVESICITGNVRSATILFSLSYNGSMFVLPESFTVIGTGGIICYYPRRALAKLMIAPRELLKGVTSSSFNMFLQIYGCYSALSAACLTAPTTPSAAPTTSTRCSVTDGLASSSYIPPSAVTGGNYTGHPIGWSVKPGNLMQLNLTWNGCQEATYLHQVCLHGNVQTAHIFIVRSIGGRSQILSQSTSASASDGHLCITIGESGTSLTVEPKSLISTRSNDTNFQFFLNLLGCFSPSPCTISTSRAAAATQAPVTVPKTPSPTTTACICPSGKTPVFSKQQTFAVSFKMRNQWLSGYAEVNSQTYDQLAYRVSEMVTTALKSGVYSSHIQDFYQLRFTEGSIGTSGRLITRDESWITAAGLKASLTSALAARSIHQDLVVELSTLTIVSVKNTTGNTTVLATGGDVTTNHILITAVVVAVSLLLIIIFILVYYMLRAGLFSFTPICMKTEKTLDEMQQKWKKKDELLNYQPPLTLDEFMMKNKQINAPSKSFNGSAPSNYNNIQNGIEGNRNEFDTALQLSSKKNNSDGIEKKRKKKKKKKKNRINVDDGEEPMRTNIRLPPVNTPNI